MGCNCETYMYVADYPLDYCYKHEMKLPKIKICNDYTKYIWE